MLAPNINRVVQNCEMNLTVQYHHSSAKVNHLQLKHLHRTPDLAWIHSLLASICLCLINVDEGHLKHSSKQLTLFLLKHVTRTYQPHVGSKGKSQGRTHPLGTMNVCICAVAIHPLGVEVFRSSHSE